MKIKILTILTILSFNALAQEQKKDTLFIKYNDKLLLKKSRNLNNNFTIYQIFGARSDHSVYFVEEKIYQNLEVNHTKCLNDIFKKPEPYKKNGTLRVDFLTEKLSKYLIFIVKGNKYSKVYLEEATE
jgi:hypothetical protein